jgi:hypothetical protein
LKSGVAHFTAREANYGESPGERLASRQFEQSWDQLAAGEIAGRAENHDRAGIGYCDRTSSVQSCGFGNVICNRSHEIILLQGPV